MVWTQPLSNGDPVSIAGRWMHVRYAFYMIQGSLALLLPVSALFASVGIRNSVTPEHQFWQWFQKNEMLLFNFEEDQERIFRQLIREMRKVNSNLTFEFGPKEEGRREFIISADGIKAAFPKVESLYEAAPPLPRWKFIKFRPRRAPSDINYAGTLVKAQSVLVEVEPGEGKVHLTVFIPGYTQSAYQAYATIAYLLLDQALGEYDVETYVGGIEIESASDTSPDACSLEALTERFDRLFPKH